MGIGVTKIRNAAKGAIIVGCNSEKDIEKFKEAAKKELGGKYKIEVPKKRMPRVNVLGIDQSDAELGDEELLNAIINQNPLGEIGAGDELRIIHKYTNNKTEKVDIILEMNAEYFKGIINRGMINIGYKRCKVNEYIRVIQCLKCCGYGHMAKECKKKIACRNCGEEHNHNECNSTDYTCINCFNRMNKFNLQNIDIGHKATYSRCPCYQKI
ncbi:hypothetical protein KPH14_000865, partial [Odynerus spinipes]